MPVATPDGDIVPYVRVDFVRYADGIPWPHGSVDGGGYSLQRRTPAAFGNDPTNWVAANPTAARANAFETAAPPVITSGPASQTAQADSTVVLSVSVTGQPELVYQWRRNGVRIPGATSETLVLEYVQFEQGGFYDVFVSNPAGAALSPAASLRVPQMPIIVQAPASQTVDPGTAVSFNVKARGSEPLRYQWRFKGADRAGASGPTLLLNDVQLEQNGPYEVEVSNPEGSAVASAYLTVLVGPRIVADLEDQSLTPGLDAVFRVGIYGAEPLSYRWRKNGSTIIPFTEGLSQITVPSVQLSNNNTFYEVIITNRADRQGIISRRAYLYVSADQDGDLVPDDWENAHGLSSTNSTDAAADSDLDGASNFQEWKAGTDPQDPASALRIERISIPTPGTALFTFTALSNKSYTAEFRPALGTGNWSRLVDIPLAQSNRVTEILNTPSPLPSERSYRLVTPRRP
jgi:hypothetical protein